PACRVLAKPAQHRLAECWPNQPNTGLPSVGQKKSGPLRFPEEAQSRVGVSAEKNLSERTGRQMGRGSDAFGGNPGFRGLRRLERGNQQEACKGETEESHDPCHIQKTYVRGVGSLKIHIPPNRFALI
ncbi:MAG: hypothetical protein KJ587_19160, partial [Alphaproteobacteria bacterium]|nr:hypothetical protein [Alphaproteobacteria bacterium]